MSTYTVKTIRMAPYFVACSMYWHCRNVCASNSTASIPDEPSSCQHCRYKSRMDSKQRYEVHPVFEMYYWRQRACQHCRYKVVWVEKQESIWICSSSICSSSIRNVLLKTESMSTLSIQGGLSRKTRIHLNMFIQYMFIQYSKCTIEDREHVDTVDTRWF